MSTLDGFSYYAYYDGHFDFGGPWQDKALLDKFSMLIGRPSDERSARTRTIEIRYGESFYLEVGHIYYYTLSYMANFNTKKGDNNNVFALPYSVSVKPDLDTVKMRPTNHFTFNADLDNMFYTQTGEMYTTEREEIMLVVALTYVQYYTTNYQQWYPFIPSLYISSVFQVDDFGVSSDYDVLYDIRFLWIEDTNEFNTEEFEILDISRTA